MRFIVPPFRGYNPAIISKSATLYIDADQAPVTIDSALGAFGESTSPSAKAGVACGRIAGYDQDPDEDAPRAA